MLNKPYLELTLIFLHFRFVAKPCALHVGIEDSGPYPAQPNAILEQVFISITKVSKQRRISENSYEVLFYRVWKDREHVREGKDILDRSVYLGENFSSSGKYLWARIL
jgi:hypothetical protein